MLAAKFSDSEWLRHYAQLFNAVEGNSTFYAAPSKLQTQRWRAQVDSTFRFCLKLPRAITHDATGLAAGNELRDFLLGIEPLQGCLGPLIVQLPPRFSPLQLNLLDRFLASAPREFCYSVEVRHPGFFDGADHESALHDVLIRHAAERCIFDTSALFAHPDPDPSTAEALRRKPRLPARCVALGLNPVVRFAGPNTVENASTATEQWALQAKAWQIEGRNVYFFCHTPNDDWVPRLCAQFLGAFKRAGGRLAKSMPVVSARAPVQSDLFSLN